MQAWPIRDFLEYFAIVTAEDTCLLCGAGRSKDHQAWSCHWQLHPASWGQPTADCHADVKTGVVGKDFMTRKDVHETFLG